MQRQKQRQVRLRQLLRSCEIATSKTVEEKKKKNIAVMLKMDGIDMIPDLRYRFTMKVVRLSGTMCLVQDY